MLTALLSFKRLNDDAAHLFCPQDRLALFAQIERAIPLRNDLLHGGLNDIGLLVQIQRMAQQEGGGENGRDGIGLVLTGDIGAVP